MHAGWTLTEAKPIFAMLDDPRPGHGVLGVSDPDVHLLDGSWSMFLGGVTSRFSVRLLEARLPAGSALTDDRWELVADHRGRAVELGRPGSADWDQHGMHTPCYVRGTAGGREVERLYYAGQLSMRISGPRSRFAIGYLERVDGTWHRRPGPIVAGDADRSSALEPFVVATEDRWRMWYVAANGEVGPGEQPDYELRYTESDDGVEWDAPQPFATPAEGFYDNAVVRGPAGWEMVLARGTNLYGTDPFPSQGLWLTTADGEPAGRSSWSPVRRLLDTDAGAEPWYAAGVCGPAVVLEDDVLHVFATGTHEPISWKRATARMLRRRQRPPMPSPFYLTTARFTFRPG